jgi:hypothetical protein
MSREEVVASDAVYAYMVAAADFNDVPLNAINQPSDGLVEEMKHSPKTAVFRIHPRDKRNDRGRFLPLTATCTYDYGTELWSIKLDAETTVMVREVDGEMVVLEDEGQP